LIHGGEMTPACTYPRDMEEKAHAARKSVVNARSRAGAGMTRRHRWAAIPKRGRSDNFSLDNNSATAA